MDSAGEADPFVVAGTRLSSRLLVGTGKFSAHPVMRDAVLASGTSLVTVALRRVDLDRLQRQVDLDLLVFGRHRIDVERPPEGRSDDPAKASLPLTVPHVESRNRLFVLAPLADLAPGLVPPGWGESVATARDRQLAAEGSDAARPIARWDGERWAGTSVDAGTSAGQPRRS